jgi:hypothetical protein
VDEIDIEDLFELSDYDEEKKEGDEEEKNKKKSFLSVGNSVFARRYSSLNHSKPPSSLSSNF